MSHGILVVDKPLGLTSHDVVARARRALGTRAVGHAGTLDPLATGVLVLAVGEATKALRYLTLDDKRYHATVQLGVTTDSLDAAGCVTERQPVPQPLTRAAIERAASGFVGSIEQRVPEVSAVKQAGVALHRRVRRGEAVQPPLRQVQVYALTILELRAQQAQFELEVHSGKGFYVRALARDLANALGTVGHLTALRRLQSGRFGLADAVTFESLAAAASNADGACAALQRALLPLSRALAPAPVLALDAAGVEHARHGRPVPAVHVTAGAFAGDAEPVLLTDGAGRPVALARSAGATLQVVRGLRC